MSPLSSETIKPFRTPPCTVTAVQAFFPKPPRISRPGCRKAPMRKCRVESHFWKCMYRKHACSSPQIVSLRSSEITFFVAMFWRLLFRFRIRTAENRFGLTTVFLRVRSRFTEYGSARCHDYLVIVMMMMFLMMRNGKDGRYFGTRS